MKTWLILLTAPLLFLTLLVAGCSDEQTKEDYEAKVERELSKIDDRINDLEAKARNSSGSARREIEDELAKTKDDRQQIGAKLRRLRDSGEDDWREVKREIDDALDDIESQLDRALSRLNRELEGGD